MTRMYEARKIHKNKYPASINFISDDVGDEPADGTTNNDADCTSTIIEILNGHYKTLALFDNNAAGHAEIYFSITQQADNIIEVWIAKSSIAANTVGYIELYEGATRIIYLQLDENDIDEWDGLAWNELEADVLVASTFLHLRIEMNDTANTYDLWVNGTETDTGVGYENNSTDGVDKVQFSTDDGDSNYYFYIDAIGYDSDMNYKIGDNRYHRHFTATYDFEDEDSQTTSTDIDFIDTDSSDANCTATIIEEASSHKKVLQIHDNSGGGRVYLFSNISGAPTSGTVSFFIKTSDATKRTMFAILNELDQVSVLVGIDADEIYYYDGATHTVCPANDNTWYYITLIADCSTDTYDIWVGITKEVTGAAFFNNGDSFGKLRILTEDVDSGYYTYFDAINCSWDPDYIPAGNRVHSYHQYSYEDITDNLYAANSFRYPYENDGSAYGNMATIKTQTTISFDTNHLLELYNNSSTLSYFGKVSAPPEEEGDGYLFHYFVSKIIDALEEKLELDWHMTETSETALQMLQSAFTNVTQDDGDLILDAPSCDNPADTFDFGVNHIEAAGVMDIISDAVERCIELKPNGILTLNTGTSTGITVNDDSDKIIGRLIIEDVETKVNFIEIVGGGQARGEYDGRSSTDIEKISLTYYNRDLKTNDDCNAYAEAIYNMRQTVGFVSGRFYNLDFEAIFNTIILASTLNGISSATYYIHSCEHDYLNNISTMDLGLGMISRSIYRESPIQSYEKENIPPQIYENYDKHVFTCYDEDDITFALDYIDASTIKFGEIVLMAMIPLTSTITIDGGGSYIIRGTGDLTGLDCNGDRTAIDIDSASRVILRDFKIDASDITTALDAKYIIDINEGSDNEVTVDSVTIVGDADEKGAGIVIQSNNVTIRDCDISQVYTGIYIVTSDSSKLRDNRCYDNGSSGITLTTSGTDISIIGNHCLDNGIQGIWLSGPTNAIVNGNICSGNEGWGIRIFGATECVIVGNTCNNNTSNSVTDYAGIELDQNTDECTVSGNVCNGNTNTGAGTTYGITISNANCDENTIVGNTMRSNDTNYNNSGTNTYEASNNRA